MPQTGQVNAIVPRANNRQVAQPRNNPLRGDELHMGALIFPSVVIGIVLGLAHQSVPPIHNKDMLFCGGIILVVGICLLIDALVDFYQQLNSDRQDNVMTAKRSAVIISGLALGYGASYLTTPSN